MVGNVRGPGKLKRVRSRLDDASRRLAALILDPDLSRSYWPDERCKSKPRIAAELLWWLARHREINAYYYVYGLDRTDTARRDELIALPEFRRLRDSGNLSGGWSYVCVLRDKLLFARVAASLNIPTPRVHAVLDAESITWLDRNTTEPLESLTRDSSLSIDGFCKPLLGIAGDGAFKLRLDRGRLLVSDAEVTLEELRNKLEGRCLLQQRIEQHPRVSALHPSSINTVRLITFYHDGHATLFSAASRIGTHGKSVDNWAAGGLIVRMDPETGELRGDGFYKPGYGGRAAMHPDTGLRFEGYAIPHFREAVEMVTRMHESLPGIHSIGWDVAISTDGPVIIEGNDNWEGGIPMVLEPDFRRRFVQMYARP